MTEEIIIDCIHKHYDSEICNAYSNNVFSWDCSEFNNCYYKQLKRLEQERDGLKSLVDFEIQKRESIEQENKELKELNKKICEDWEKEIKVYWNALEEIKEMTKKYDAEVGDTILANPIQDCYDIYCKINEILDKG